MVMNSYLFIFLFVLFILFVLFLYFKKKEEAVNSSDIDNFIEETNTKEPDDSCFCCFDLDQTLTCSIRQAKEAISECRKNKCILGINTARSGPYLNDVPLNELDLSLNEIKNDIYHGSGPNILATFTSAKDFNDHIARKKLDHLYTIKNKYNLNPKRIIFFDDNYNNIKLAKENGFSTIHANNPMCGLNNNVSRQIDSILT